MTLLIRYLAILKLYDSNRDDFNTPYCAIIQITNIRMSYPKIEKLRITKIELFTCIGKLSAIKNDSPDFIIHNAYTPSMLS